MRIALDAMGGDLAPEPNLAGAISALHADPELEIVLVGEPSILEPSLAKLEYPTNRLSIQESDGTIGMEEKPTKALREKPNASILVCWRLMANHEVDAVVTAGNTGAVVAAGLRTRLYLKGVKRPGIAVTLPTLAGRAVLIDVGANPNARPEHLFQYGVMGCIYAREMLQIENPRVGLMNIGSEDSKGTDLYRETHQLLSQSCLKDQYRGNIEGRGLYGGEADVLLCEGFVGNVVLKVSEGMAEYMLKVTGKALLNSLQSEKDLALTALENLKKQYQYREAGGAPLLGIAGICIICHGSSDSRSIQNAIHVAGNFQARHINEQIVEELSKGQN